jgi:hypothetical protein
MKPRHMILSIIIDNTNSSAVLRCRKITEYNYVLSHIKAIGDNILSENSTVNNLTVLLGDIEMFQWNPLADMQYRENRRLDKLRANLEIAYTLECSQSVSASP